MINRISPKAGIYFSHYECFGPTSRVMAVGEAFKKRFPSGNLFFIQAGLPQPLARIDQLGLVHSLSGPFMDRRYFKEPVDGTEAKAIKRTEECIGIVTDQKPDLFITESFPLGREECRHELIPPLVKTSAQGAILWAVAGYPLLTGTNDEWRREVMELYDQIIIFSPLHEKEIIADSFSRSRERQSYLDFFDQYAQKIIFGGYLLPQQELVRITEEVNKNIHKPPVPQGACRVAVVRGSGAVNPKMIAQAIRASDQLGKEYYLTVISGPSTTAQEWYFFGTLVAQKKVNNLVLLQRVGDYEGLLQENDICVSDAGYHTSVVLLKYRKKAVIIPFGDHGPMLFKEQPARAAMLKEMIGAEVLSGEDLTADTLTAAVKHASACPEIRSNIPQEWFMGRDVLDKALRGLGD